MSGRFIVILFGLLAICGSLYAEHVPFTSSATAVLEQSLF